jgi:leader peptidase (prepilin peptidase) / N-methyltransferase
MGKYLLAAEALEAIMGWPINATCLVFAVGSPAIGSFLGAAADRWQHGESVTFCRSKCASCSAVLQARDLVPFVSYCALGGRCRFCDVRIPKKLFVIEVLAVSVTLTTQALVTPELRITATLFAWLLLALSWFDYELGRLPDALTIPLGVAGLGIAALTTAAFPDHLLGAALGLALPAGIAFVYKHLRGRDGLGGGDVKMLAAIGAWVGWQGLPAVLFLASFGSLAFALRRGGVAASDSVRFGPFIAAAAWAVWVWRPLGVTL